MKLYEKIKVGRPARFKDAQQLWEEALQYFEWCEQNPVEIYLKGKKRNSTKEDAKEMQQGKVTRPYTLDGLCVWLNIQMEWGVFKSNSKRREDWAEFEKVINACEQCVRSQQITGAMAGLYSERLTARLNGISEKVDATLDQRKTTVSWEEYQRMLNGENIDKE